MIGLVSLNTGNMWICPSYWFITNDNTLNVVLKNTSTSSSAETIGLSAGILYMTNS